MEGELSKRQIEKHIYERIFIILKSAEGYLNKDISEELGCDKRQVGIWRKRRHIRTEELDITIDADGKTVSDSVIVEMIQGLLSDNPRSGCPARITEEELVRLQALACERPADYNLPFTVWTHQQ